MKLLDKISIARGSGIIDQMFRPDSLSEADVVSIVAAHLAYKLDTRAIKTDADKLFDPLLASRLKQAFSYFGHSEVLWEFGPATDDIRFVDKALAKAYPDVNTHNRIILSR